VRSLRARCLAALLAAALASPAAVGAGSAWDLHGHVKAQLSERRFAADDVAARLGRDLADALLDARLDVAAHAGRWNLVAQGQLLGAQGDSLRLLRDPVIGALAGRALTVPGTGDPRSWFDLDRALTDSGSRRLVARLDRLSAGWTGDHLVLRVGRQALSWGNGLVFNVLDLFDPFPPNAADTEYKPGTDMVWGQWLFANGDDLQMLMVPRRDPATGDLRRDQSSFAAQWHHVAGSTELGLVAARHFDDDVLGVGASHDLAGGVARIDMSHTRLAGGRGVFSALVNLDHSWIWRGKNVYGFGELLHNGFGARHPGRGVEALDPALLARLERGELFAVGRDEAALGARVEVTALTSFEPTLVAGLHDGSGLALLHLRHDLGDETRLDTGLQLPWGARGTEYGGLPVAAGLTPPLYLSAGRRLWLRISRYF